MNFLKKLFGGGGSSGDEFTLYVKPKMCNRIMPIVVKRKEQLSLNDSEDGYWVRKIANHPRCPFEVEVIIHFDRRKNLSDKEISNGEFVDEAAYLAFLENDEKKSPT
ncbi:MAG: hypothetical protein Q9P44_02150 [Anaerolineae bacterium]|nr:hypothetical protein [Anaerolineae bacterium]